MNSYQIVGLNLSTVVGNSYETEDGSSYRIKHDILTGKGITKEREFKEYILYIIFENTYYAIHLSSSHCASFGGRLCSLGSINITPTDSIETLSNITHVPIKKLFIPVAFELKNCDYEQDIRVCLSDEPNTLAFDFSYIGNNEHNPSGYVSVNMGLFYEIMKL